MKVQDFVTVDWLSFTFKPSEADKATFYEPISAFFHYFPKFEEIFSECVVFGSGRGRYFDNCVAWNDNILISWDNSDTDQEATNCDAWDHGINVCIPSHGLANIWEMFDLSCPSNEVDQYKIVYQFLKDRNCQISRLDIAFDDFTKTFYPSDFLHFWDQDCIQSPCKKFRYCGSGKNGGQTFYLGARSNKMLRIYDKNVESGGKINSIRYEIETHNRYANELSEMVLADNFDFYQYLEKYFMVIKVQNEGRAHVEKKYNSRLKTSEDWENWKNTGLANKKQIIFPKTPNDVNMDKKRRWLYRQVIKSLLQLIKVDGIDSIFDVLETVNLNNRDMQIINDSLRIHNISEDLFMQGVQKYQVLKEVSRQIDNCFK